MPYSYKGYGFSERNDGFVNVWTDGACFRNGTPLARAGVGVFFGKNHPLNVSQPLQSDRQTNIVAEIQAVTIAAIQARKARITKLIINTDSKFIIDCFEEHLDKWKSNGWINSRGVPVVNKPDFQKMEAALSYFNYEWLHVSSHNGIYGNVMADKLAREGIFA